MALHFVGFRGNEYVSAILAFGKPDFYHMVNDRRAIAEYSEGDTVVFANGSDEYIQQYTYDDSAHY